MTLREWRHAKRLSLQQVAEKVGVSYSQVARIETGKSKPSPDVASRIEAATGGEVSAARLLGLLAETPSKGLQEESAAFVPHLFSNSAQLMKEAASYGLDVDQIVRKAVEDAVKAERIRRWNEENREAIESWNKLVEREGLWSDGIRAF